MSKWVYRAVSFNKVSQRNQMRQRSPPPLCSVVPWIPRNRRLILSSVFLPVSRFSSFPYFALKPMLASDPGHQTDKWYTRNVSVSAIRYLQNWLLASGLPYLCGFRVFQSRVFVFSIKIIQYWETAKSPNSLWPLRLRSAHQTGVCRVYIFLLLTRVNTRCWPRFGLKNNERSWRRSYHQLKKNVVLCRRPNQAENCPYVLKSCCRKLQFV